MCALRVVSITNSQCECYSLFAEFPQENKSTSLSGHSPFCPACCSSWGHSSSRAVLYCWYISELGSAVRFACPLCLAQRHASSDAAVTTMCLWRKLQLTIHCISRAVLFIFLQINQKENTHNQRIQHLCSTQSVN